MTIRSIFHAEPLTARDRAWLSGVPDEDDPAELLARCAAYHGRLAVEAYSGNYSGFLAEPVRADPDALLAGHRARLAWRYASAAVALLGGAAHVAQLAYLERRIADGR
jgi:hypothetical protein